MVFSKSDFDVTNPIVVLRLMCGLFYIPHVVAKIINTPALLGFFTVAGFPAPLYVLILAGAVEALCALGLTLNIYVKWIGLMSAGTMVVAIYALFTVKGVGWMWNVGGVEYLVFWGASSLALALHAWKQEFATHGRVTLFGSPHMA